MELEALKKQQASVSEGSSMATNEESQALRLATVTTSTKHSCLSALPASGAVRCGRILVQYSVFWCSGAVGFWSSTLCSGSGAVGFWSSSLCSVLVRCGRILVQYSVFRCGRILVQYSVFCSGAVR